MSLTTNSTSENRETDPVLLGTLEDEARIPSGSLSVRPQDLFAGLMLVSAIAGAAVALRLIPALATFSPMILAILIGILFKNLLGTPTAAKPGIAFAMRRILRLGVILLGLQLTASQVMAVGTEGLIIVILAVIGTFAFTTWLGRRLGVEPKLTQLIGAGTSICGASAVLATDTVTNAPDEDVAYAVACITVFGTIAMFTYPLLPGLLGLTPEDYGLWAGVSIHEVAQVVGAAYQQGQAAGDFGTIAKLSRVMLLAPIVIGLGMIAQSHSGAKDDSFRRGGSVPLPWFVLGFIAMIGVNSIVDIPPAAMDMIVPLTTFLLAMALAAMGLETDIAKLRAKGLRPAMLGACATLFIAAFSLLLIKMIP